MLLVRLIYASRLKRKTGPDDIEAILAAARERNEREGITGMLCFTTDYFIQCLEGPRSAVNALYRDIMADPRHEEALLLDYREIAARDFEYWAMAYVGPGEINQDILLKHSRARTFDPYTMTAASAHALLLLLKQQLPPPRSRTLP